MVSKTRQGTGSRADPDLTNHPFNETTPAYGSASLESDSRDLSGTGSDYDTGAAERMPPHSVSRAEQLNDMQDTQTRSSDAQLPSTHHETRGYNSGPNNTSVTGNAPGTAGPHKYDWANKLDPRIDSDRDGSRRLVRGNHPEVHLEH